MVKKNFGSKTFWFKKRYWVKKKILAKKISGSKRFWVNIFFCQKFIRSKLFLGQSKCFWLTTKDFDQKFFGKKNWVKKCLGQIFCWVKKYLGKKNLGNKNFMSKKFSCHKVIESNNIWIKNWYQTVFVPKNFGRGWSSSWAWLEELLLQL